MTRYGMVIDLMRCIGCHACTVACKAENFVPPGIFWGNVVDIELGKYPKVDRLLIPKLCMHCQDAPCVSVCPTKASYQREDGIVLVDQERCIGCGLCLTSCPYEARFMNWEKRQYFKEGLTPYEEFPDSLRAPTQRHKLGITEKCTFCVHKIDKGLAKGLKPGVDRAATPTCVNVCPTVARHFGDLDDPESNVSRLIKELKGFTIHPELGTKPSVYYLPAHRHATKKKRQKAPSK